MYPRSLLNSRHLGKKVRIVITPFGISDDTNSGMVMIRRLHISSSEIGNFMTLGCNLWCGPAVWSWIAERQRSEGVRNNGEIYDQRAAFRLL